MLLEADTLTFDNDRDTVTAAGGVQIDYDGNRLVARRVTYDRRTGRLMASGDVEIVDPEGTKIYSDQIDVTDDFAEGFLNALQVETTDKTYFGAESARRQDDNVTTFNNGVYTACEPCEEQPDKPAIWRIKSQTIVWNQKKKTIRFHNARFELFGLPIAYFPFMEVPDHTVKRKTGFLTPGIAYKSDLGFGVKVPFYVALSPTYDLTFSGTYYSKQGFLGEAEWRQQFNNGQYNLKVAGIHQQDPEELRDDRGRPTVGSGLASDPNKTRLMLATKGDFKINPRWAFGWDILVQSDKNFSRDYGIDGYDQLVHRSEIYLTGLNERNYFDLRAMRFQYQEASLDYPNPARGLSASVLNPRQAWALPTFDYSYTPDEPIAGGELNIDINSRILYREELDFPGFTDTNRNGIFDPGEGPGSATRGLQGTTGRTTAEAEWKRSFITPGGLVITPLLHAQGDATFLDVSSQSIAAINAQAASAGVSADVRASYYRYMATAGLELRWPVLFSTTSASHVLEPIAQIFARPDERYAGSLGIPNEDAQSLVFDAASLFERDKFSGYDRIEGGTRANLGFRYSGTFADGWTANAIFGQSFHLAGVNSYASPDLVNAGAFSGLETDRSDYVGLVGLGTPFGLSMAAAGRFDEEDFDMRRGELRAAYRNDRVTVSTQYAFIEAQPRYGFPNDREEITVGGRLQFHENWSTYGGRTYDIEGGYFSSDRLGFAYADECIVFGVTLTQTRSSPTAEVDRSFGFQLSLRTLGDFGTNSSAFQN
ncbi:MAG: LPS-assembly protein LptD [Rhizobiaceae bacterium]|nr:LPS-assembly protein LptD [Rhizobiaceae bacterium]MCV0406455.1 LPS-assembly protein LptD [Rhizobiaceae bacterium]